MTTRIPTDAGALAVHAVGDTPRIVLWPGLFFDASQHRPLAERLANRGWGSLLVDPPGFGDSGPPPAGLDLPACGRALVQVAAARGIERPVLGGTSWGGIAAVHAGLDAPDRVGALVLMNTPFGGGAARGVIRFLPWLVRLPPSLVVRGAAASAFGETALARDGAALRAHLARSLQRADRDALPDLVRMVLHDRPSVRDRLGDLRVPALLVSGSEDVLVPPRRRALPDVVEPAQIHAAGHSAALEDPGAVAERVLAFLEETRAVRRSPGRSSPAPPS